MSQPRAYDLEPPSQATVIGLNPSKRAEHPHVRPCASVPISALVRGDSPRSSGEDATHVARLAELDDQLPPILVDRRSMRVIDGMHRLAAAALRGHSTIEVEFFEGSADEAFLRSVEANVSHGLPLSREDRRTAAVRIVASHPHLSDRAIARASGLSAKSVAAIRQRTAGTASTLTSRVGRDGKVRPVNNADGRRRAAELIVRHPEASLREVAREAGISPATVLDVRKRLASGDLPVPAPASSPTGADEGHQSSTATIQQLRRQSLNRPRPATPEPAAQLESLLRDPSLRMREDGRKLLRLLQHVAVGPQDVPGLASAVPSHCSEMVADLVRQHVAAWLKFTRELDDRAGYLHDGPGEPPRPTGTA
ncbi:ParB/RepB/Spo0J family partition protein [Pseudonocardia spinosispora]|uniref:ParB/RepB/Spo0J family partition protein n=1 Tax=Pseudonocardia spinosispora TaxID=103441 RepID=UPI00041B60E6|nr:ParB/RepB/Spo0J family partition protein [Pseudonocardia spinosispora]